MQLTTQQDNALNALMDFLNADVSQQFFVLQGYAGTGKTTIIQHLQQRYNKLRELHTLTQTNYISRTWNFTATTHKAVSYLHQTLHCSVETLHAFLGIRVRTDYSSGENYSFRPKHLPMIENSIVIVDECSYIDEYLLKIVTTCFRKCKVIFVGDPAQLTPVRASNTPVFEQGFPTFELTDVVRQDKQSPIQEICTDLRKTIKDLVGLPKIKRCAEITHLSQAQFDQAIEQEFSRPQWKAGDSKILAWRNKTVQSYNNYLFKKFTGRSEFKQGDYVINNHHVLDMKSDTECMITHVQPSTSLGVSGKSIRVDVSKNTYFLADGFESRKKMITKLQKNPNEADMQTIVDHWIDLRPAYACTINKSQGSTYNTVYIDLGDLADCKDVLQFARMLYVAISRAKSHVVFTGDLS